ncbi:MAG: hexosaminidase [Bacteroidetes bacterium]|nr:MAG: hexosaminidase [Bacteroidota bacterium]
MRKILFALFFISSCASFGQQPGDSLLPLIPQPVSVMRMPGVFQLRQHTPLILGKDVLRSDAEIFAANVEKYYGIKIDITEKKTSGGIRLQQGMEELKSLPENAYRVTMNKNEVLVEGKGDGVFYGLQTLLQLIPAEPVTEYNIPCVNITDYPRFSWRGMHLDVSRHFFGKNDVKKYLDYLSLYKLNVFHWHLTDDQGWRIEIKSRPELTKTAAWRKGTLIGHYTASPVQYDNTRYGGFYTQEDVKEIIAYAQQRHITVVPEIEMPGHSMAVLAAYPELACTKGPFETAQTWGVFNDVLCTKPETFKFLEDVLAEICALFPGNYIHIGGDECPKDRWKECAQCQAVKKTTGAKDEHELQSWFIQKIEKFVNSKGKQIIGWDEILEGGLAPGAAVMSWRGEGGGIEAAKQKHNVVMSPTSNCYFDYYQSQAAGEPLAIGGYLPLEKVYDYDPLPEAISVGDSKYILGLQGNVWTEYIADFRKVEYMAMPRMSALAEVGWTSKRLKNYDLFTQRLAKHMLVLDRMDVNYCKAIFYIESQLSPPANGKPGVMLDLRNRAKGEIIRFSMNEDEVNANSPVFEKPIQLMRTSEIRAASYKGTARRSPEFRQNYEISFSTGKPVKLLTDPDPQYNTGGGFTLVNGVTGRIPWNGSDWLGYKGKNLEAVIDLGITASVRMVRVDALKDEGSWIYFPKSIEVLGSNDRLTYTSIKKIQGDELGNRRNINIIVGGLQMARYVKVVVENAGTIPEGKPGAGNPAWLFVDEIIVE